MTKVWIVEGEHHYVPGIVVKVCASQAAANREAADLAKIIINDIPGDKEDVVTANNWEELLSAAVVSYADHFNSMPRVEISEHEVIA